MTPQPELPAISAGDAFPVDPNFPQLEIAGDSRRMLELFRRHLMPAAGKRCHIQDCTPFRFRCRQSGSRCVLQYTLRVVEPSSGRQWDQWVACLAYARAGEAELSNVCQCAQCLRQRNARIGPVQQQQIDPGQA